jgi:DNA topoisomerase-3
MTSVIGHLTTQEFDEAHSKWHSCDPFTLFDAPVKFTIASNSEDIEKNLISEARRSDMLMVWTDCDREGEHIGWEIARVCRGAKRNIEVKRARFSAIIAQYVQINAEAFNI